MNICMVCLCLGEIDRNPLIGGHENTVLEFSKELFKNNNKITIITTPPAYSDIINYRIVEMEWGKVISIPLSASYGSMGYVLEFLIKGSYEIVKLNNKERFDIIHGHSGYSALGLLTGFFGFITGVPSIHSLYCPLSNSPFMFIFDKICLSLNHLIITLSKNTARSLEKIGISDEKIRIIPPPVATKFFINSKNFIKIKNQLKIGFDDPTIFYLGDLTETRGLNILIDSFLILKSKFPLIKLIIAINVPMDIFYDSNCDIYNKIKNLGLSDSIFPLGILNNIQDVMVGSDIFVAPYTDIEGIADYPISILEAIASGTPVVASNVGGISEIIHPNKNGLLVRPKNIEDLVKAISFIIESKSKFDESLNKDRSFIDSFRVDIVVKNLSKLYMEVIGYHHSN